MLGGERPPGRPLREEVQRIWLTRSKLAGRSALRHEGCEVSLTMRALIHVMFNAQSTLLQEPSTSANHQVGPRPQARGFTCAATPAAA